MNRERRISGRRIRRQRRIAARLDATAQRLGLYLLPWQRDFAVAWLDGDRQFVEPRGRRAGRATVARVVASQAEEAR